jgi:O-antigen/teichoic acid export membrane protein
MRIARGTALNLVGLSAPLPLAVFVVPSLLEGLGTEGFALLTLMWVLTSYAGLLDLGLGRALTQKLATTLDLGVDSAQVGSLCATAFGIILILGLGIGLALFFCSDLLLSLLQLDKGELEAISALQLVAVSVPFTLLSAGSRGALEALMAFGRVNAVRLPLGIWTFLGPWLAVQQDGGLFGVALALLIGRVFATSAWTWMAWRALPGWRKNPKPTRRWLPSLFRTGGWLTVGNLVGPLMGYADRFLVAVLLSVSAAAYYATPQELVSKLWVLPGALMSVIFPALAQRLASGGPNAAHLCRVALRWIVLLCLPLSVALALPAPELLNLWLGPEFSEQSSSALRWMAFGMFMGCVAQLPFTLLQSADAASTTAKLHLIQLPIFLLAMVWVVPRAGVAGAAAVWAIRNMLDAFCLFILCHKRFPHLSLWSSASLIGVLGLAVLAFAGLLLDSFLLRSAWWCGLTLLLVVMAWRNSDQLRFPSQ